MRADAIANNQLMIAQGIAQLAHQIEQSTGYQLTPVPFGELPLAPQAGMIGAVTDGVVSAGGVVTGGGDKSLLVFFDGADWLIAAGQTGVATVTVRSITFAELPTAPVQGMLTCVRDSNRDGYGQSITGSGPYIVLAFYDGTDWVVK
jgi:hypothetical protein